MTTKSLSQNPRPGIKVPGKVALPKSFGTCSKEWASYFVFSALVLAVAVCVEKATAREGSSAREQSPGRVRAMPSRSNEAGRPESHRLREGTIINDQNGTFREDGDGATFVADTGLEFGSLPNLNLERILRLLKSSEKPSSIRWSVTGKVTEFSGRNFLLISRAVYKSATPPPVPDRVTQ